MAKKTAHDMSHKLLCFKTKRDVNGNTYNVVVDVDNKLFVRDRYYSGPDFITVSRKDLRELISRLVWIGFEEVN